MKNYGKLIPVLLILGMLLSWYSIFSSSVSINKEYKTYLKDARTYAKQGVTKYAIENYLNVLEIKSTPEIYEEVGEYYLAQKDYDEFIAWAEQFVSEYSHHAKAYELLLKGYVLLEDVPSCYEVIDVVGRRNIKSKYIDGIAKKLKYAYRIDFNNYDDVGVYSNNFSPVKSDEFWGFVNRYGNQRVSSIYKDVGFFTSDGICPVLDQQDNAYYIDNTGVKVKVLGKKLKKLGAFVSDGIVAQDSKGRYAYYDTEGNKLFGDFDYASTLNFGIGAVKNKDSWNIVNSKGKKVVDDVFVDVKLDEKEIAFRNDRMFVAKKPGQYIMVDGKGRQVGNKVYQDAKVFSGNSYAAVKVNDVWRFIDKKGNFISKKTYQDARSFTNGLAAVCIDSKWGFVDENETLVIKNTFYGAKDFNERGSCFVQTGECWQLLKLYSLNRED